ncbi:MAG: hypothetical protein GX683_01300 [Ruminococcaceae bacterium]|jgi:hypothetical protein|nr:hypothetical protein [Oscillospiraceae bacterium]
MNKQHYFEKPNRSIAQGAALSFVIAAAALIIAQVSLGRIGLKANEQSLTQARNSVSRAVVLCYASEGVYPESLDYLEENYGLVLDSELYLYHYRSLGGNLFPEIAVFENEA